MLLPIFLLALVGGKSEQKREREKDTPDSHPLGGRLLFSLAFSRERGGEAKAYGVVDISFFVPSYIDLLKEFHLQHTSEQSKERDGNVGLALHGT